MQSTGIGCFFAPWVQAVLKVNAPNWADVYHVAPPAMCEDLYFLFFGMCEGGSDCVALG